MAEQAKGKGPLKIVFAVLLVIILLVVYQLVIKPWLANRARPLPTNPLLVKAREAYERDMLNWLKDPNGGKEWYANIQTSLGRTPTDADLLDNIRFSAPTTSIIYTYKENGAKVWEGPVQALYGY